MPVFDFCGILAEMVTPFQYDAIDFPSTERLAKHLRQSGVTGLVVCATSGEGLALSVGDQMDVIDTVIKAVPGFPVVAGLTGYDFEILHAQLLRYNTRQLAGVLVPANCYTRPSQDGLRNFFHTIADVSNHPIVINNSPHPLGAALDLNSMVQLSQHANIVAIKDDGEDRALTEALITKRQLKVLAGDDGKIFTTLSLGGAGAIAAIANVMPTVLVNMQRDLQGGHTEEAKTKFESLQPLMTLLRSEAHPAAVKTALSVMGLMKDEVRFPLIRGSGRLRSDLKEEFRRFNLIRPGSLA
jgi:4-hydroxy-tetrahydrodipicolinate synthase